jgi:hypothetical protein
MGNGNQPWSHHVDCIPLITGLDFNYRTSSIGLPIVRLLSDIKWGVFPIFCVFLHEFFTFLNNFWRTFAEHMSCWHPYCAVGFPADAISVVG